jgi:hypothetical protein
MRCSRQNAAAQIETTRRGRFPGRQPPSELPTAIKTRLAGTGHLGLISVTPKRPNQVVFVISIRGAQRFRLPHIAGSGRGYQELFASLAAGCPVPDKSAWRHGSDLPGPDRVANDQGTDWRRKPVKTVFERTSCHSTRPNRMVMTRSR